MEIVSALLCDFVTVHEGLVHVLGGGVTRIWRTTVPATLGVSLALTLEVPSEEMFLPHEVHVLVKDPEQNRLAEVTGGTQAPELPIRLEPGEAVLVSLALPLQSINVLRYGRHDLDISVDKVPARTLHAWVLHPDERSLPPLA